MEIVNLVENTVADSCHRLKFAHLRICSMITNKGLLINLCLGYLLVVMGRIMLDHKFLVCSSTIMLEHGLNLLLEHDRAHHYLLGRWKFLQCPSSPGETRTGKKLWNRYLRLTCHIYSCLFLLTSSHPCTTTVYYRTSNSLLKAVIKKRQP